MSLCEQETWVADALCSLGEGQLLKQNLFPVIYLVFPLSLATFPWKKKKISGVSEELDMLTAWLIYSSILTFTGFT